MKQPPAPARCAPAHRAPPLPPSTSTGVLRRHAAACSHRFCERVDDDQSHESRQHGRAGSTSRGVGHQERWCDVQQEAEHRTPISTLTDRERQVLDLMAQGRSNAAISEELHVSDNATTKHISDLFAKFGSAREPRRQAAGTRGPLVSRRALTARLPYGENAPRSARRVREEAQVVHGERQFRVAHDRCRLTGLLDFHPGQLVGVLRDEVRNRQQQPGLDARSACAPTGVGLPGLGHHRTTAAGSVSATSPIGSPVAGFTRSVTAHLRGERPRSGRPPCATRRGGGSRRPPWPAARAARCFPAAWSAPSAAAAG